MFETSGKITTNHLRSKIAGRGYLFRLLLGPQIPKFINVTLTTLFHEETIQTTSGVLVDLYQSPRCGRTETKKNTLRFHNISIFLMNSRLVYVSINGPQDTFTQAYMMSRYNWLLVSEPGFFGSGQKIQ